MKIDEIKLCKRCGQPTNRHYTARHCFPCMNLNNKENNKKSNDKIRGKAKDVQA